MMLARQCRIPAIKSIRTEPDDFGINARRGAVVDNTPPWPILARILLREVGAQRRCPHTT